MGRGRIRVWRPEHDRRARPRPYIDPEIREWLRFEAWRRLVEGNRGIDFGRIDPRELAGERHVWARPRL